MLMKTETSLLFFIRLKKMLCSTEPWGDFTDLYKDAEVSWLCIQEAFNVAARISVSGRRAAGGAAGSAGQTGKHFGRRGF